MHRIAASQGRPWPSTTHSPTKGENFSLFSMNWGEKRMPVLVVAMSGLHGYFISLGRKIARGERPIETKKLRMLNELPMVIAILAVIMVVVQPFSR
jgi:putative membrane protein